MSVNGSGAAIRIEGLDKLSRDLRKLELGLDVEMKAAAFEAALVVAKAANAHVPVVTGRLAKSIRAMATARAATVKVGGASIPYASPIHWGWPAHGIRPNKFLVRALDEKRPLIAAIYAKRIEALKRKAFG